jgi:integration host factor subunit alpha
LESVGGIKMASRNVTRIDLAEAVYQTVGLSRHESAELVGQVIGKICDTLAAGETVKLSSFGVFTVRNKGERVGRNPKTNVEVPIEPRRVVTFSASHVLKAHVNSDKQNLARGRAERVLSLEVLYATQPASCVAAGGKRPLPPMHRLHAGPGRRE